jgi:hypothetical protein
MNFQSLNQFKITLKKEKGIYSNPSATGPKLSGDLARFGAGGLPWA